MQNLETATISGGCFWCTEAIFIRLKGVESVTSGYAGGRAENPTYEQVVKGTTGFAEAVQIKFDPSVISYLKILEVFLATHDPTSLNKQGNDEGPEYRSAIFYHGEKQKNDAEQAIKKDQANYSQKIVTEVTPFTNFYTAEEYHQKFYDTYKNSNMYCQIVIDPKIKKLTEKFKDLVKSEYLVEN